MNVNIQQLVPACGAPARAVRRSGCWVLQEHGSVTSTNLVAASLPAWHAVRADTQSAGRGRYQRSWISDEGGLWLSAVLPIDATTSRSTRILPLAAGLAVCDMLRAIGADCTHMRWPNDILVGHRKLAGLLIDQFVPGRAVVGIGINVNNRPECGQADLAGQVLRLSDLVPVPSLQELTDLMLGALHKVWGECQTLGPEALLPGINSLWRTARTVQLELESGHIAGRFEGVDAAGRLMLRASGSGVHFFEPHEVRFLRETG
jgi:BirA family transcriptional regulator, biotin operon repressor / biotin---[acetyl-CoA-carboxylase] ligase